MKLHTRVTTVSYSAGGRVRRLALAVSLVAMAFSAAPAAADGGIPQPPPQPLTAAETLRLGVKSDVANNYAQFKLAGGTPAQFTT